MLVTTCTASRIWEGATACASLPASARSLPPVACVTACVASCALTWRVSCCNFLCGCESRARTGVNGDTAAVLLAKQRVAAHLVPLLWFASQPHSNPMLRQELHVLMAENLSISPSHEVKDMAINLGDHCASATQGTHPRMMNTLTSKAPYRHDGLKAPALLILHAGTEPHGHCCRLTRIGTLAPDWQVAADRSAKFTALNCRASIYT